MFCLGADKTKPMSQVSSPNKTNVTDLDCDGSRKKPKNPASYHS